MIKITSEQVAFEICKLLFEVYLAIIIIAIVAIGLFMAWYALDWTPLEIILR